jgi:hypothetical protein
MGDRAINAGRHGHNISTRAFDSAKINGRSMPHRTGVKIAIRWEKSGLSPPFATGQPPKVADFRHSCPAVAHFSIVWRFALCFPACKINLRRKPRAIGAPITNF